MQYRELGRTGLKISAVSFGAWAIGGAWGEVNDKESLDALHKAVDLGVNFIDTADVYGDGRSERLIARLKKERSEEIIVATKAGRRLDPHTAEGYNPTNLNIFVERSLKNLEVEALDLLQLHCPPTEVYYRPEIFQALDDMILAGKLRYYGVSVEKVEEAIKAVEYPNVQSVQIIYSIFRQRPSDLFFRLALQKKVGILARVPLSSGMLTGKMTRETRFRADDHRQFNRGGEAFDKGETFSGIDFDLGLQAVDELRPLVPAGWSMAQFALNWILMSEAVTCAIPGAKSPAQVAENMAAADLPLIPEQIMIKIKELYERLIKLQVHDLW